MGRRKEKCGLGETLRCWGSPGCRRALRGEPAWSWGFPHERLVLA
ncbi:hypothetical protein [Dendronalium sp. ChiSLP03b]